MIKLNELNDKATTKLLNFMKSKLKDSKYIRRIEDGGNECNMDWIKGDLNISGEDMVHELFELYAKCIEDKINIGGYAYILKIDDDTIISTYKNNDTWFDKYYELGI